jgi:tetratricopeptide (TPR) repeat protein
LTAEIAPGKLVGDVWSGYSTREAAELVGLSESAIRSCVRAGFLLPGVTGVALRFSFRDLAVLKIVKSLTGEGVPLSRLRRQLHALRRQLPSDASLAGMSISAHAGHVIVRDADRAWRADTGQMVFDFEVLAAAGELASMPVRREAAAPEPVASLTADEWFDRAVELEEADAPGAVAAYKRALRLAPDCSEIWINLGRLYAETGESERAAECFRKALELDPGDATAIYNLGVVAQDAGDDTDAVTLYQRALGIDPTLAEAHYNLATIFDRGGDPRLAIRHINEYRKLMREPR